MLAVLIDAGSAAAHRAWRPSHKELDAMMTILEGFLHRSILLDDVAHRLKKVVPSKHSQLPKP